MVYRHRVNTYRTRRATVGLGDALISRAGTASWISATRRTAQAGLRRTPAQLIGCRTGRHGASFVTVPTPERPRRVELRSSGWKPDALSIEL